MKNLKLLIFSALFAALACVSTMIIKIPTPTMGYIHPGDGVVLLSGILLGPLYGGLAAGFGSMLADLFSGYVSYAPATFAIKFGAAAIAGFFVGNVGNRFSSSARVTKLKRNSTPQIIIGGALAEAFMVIGYFVFEIFMFGLAAAANIPFNVTQGIFGVAIATVLYPLLESALKKI